MLIVDEGGAVSGIRMAGETKVPRENLSQFYVVHHRLELKRVYILP
jgi:hypothetical protein